MHPHLQLASVLPPNPSLIALCIGSTVIARFSANELFIKDIISLGLYLTFGGLHLLHSMGQTQENIRGQGEPTLDIRGQGNPTLDIGGKETKH